MTRGLEVLFKRRLTKIVSALVNILDIDIKYILGRHSQWLNMMKISWVKRWRTARYYLWLSFPDVPLFFSIDFTCPSAKLFSLPYLCVLYHTCISVFLPPTLYSVPSFSQFIISLLSQAPPIFLCASSFRFCTRLVNGTHIHTNHYYHYDI